MASSLTQNRGNKNTNRTGATVSRKLRAAGWNISPAARRYAHNGTYVSAQGDAVSILIDLGCAATNSFVAEQMVSELVHWDCAPDEIEIKLNDELGFCLVRFDYQR